MRIWGSCWPEVEPCHPLGAPLGLCGSTTLKYRVEDCPNIRDSRDLPSGMSLEFCLSNLHFSIENHSQVGGRPLQAALGLCLSFD